MTVSRSPRAVEPLDALFRRFALLFGSQPEQQATFQYLERLTAANGPGSRRRGAPLSTARERRELMERLSWHAAGLRAPLQTWLLDQVGATGGWLVLSERVFARRETRGDGIAPHYSAATGAVVNGQLGLFLSLVTPDGRATLDGRLVAPTISSPMATKTDLAMEMLGTSPATTQAGVLAPAVLGDDEGFRAALRTRSISFVVEVSAATPVFRSAEPRTSGRRRSAAPPKDLNRVAVSSLFQTSDNGSSAHPSAVAVWEVSGGIVGAQAWALTLPGATGQADRYFIASSEPQGDIADGVAEALDHPSASLDAGPGTSILDQYDATSIDAWHRHIILGLIASAWLAQGAAEPPGGRADTTAPEPTTTVRTLAVRSSLPLPLNEPGQQTPPRSLPGRAPSRIWGARLLAFAAIGLVGLMLLTVLGIARSLPALGQTDLIRLSSFYHPPEDGTSVNTVVARTRQVIYTRGDERYLQQMRDLGFRGPTFQYLVANEASGPERATSASARCGDYLQTGNDVSGIARDFCTTLHGDERNFLHNGKGERLFSSWNVQEGGATRTRYYYLMNPGSPGWREYFIRRAQENVATLPFGGLFLDNIDLTTRRGRDNERNSDGRVAEYPSERDYQTAVLEGLAAVRTGLPSAPIWANLTEGENQPDEYLPYLPYLDGVMNEYFITQERGRAVGPNGWAAQIAQADSVLAQGKSFLAVSQGSKTDVNRMRFALASYLMIAGPTTYFRYSDGEKYHEAWFYDELENRLGSPLGRRYQRGDLWQRDFACGTVTVDIERRAGDINVRARQPGCLVERLLVTFPLFPR